ncbi:MAG TPA: TraR/DksA C4-type zinc finger protein [Anaerolineae bacterium]|jgi:RNA polymerase-binding protein DksA|nr:TraR/DksA C4-type zinc finger protein [Anaerolineae bacterium]
MDEKEIERFKEWLLNEKERLEKEIKYVESTMDQSEREWTGELNAYDNHMGDFGFAQSFREDEISIARNARDLLARVNAALRRIDEGTYGLCVVCGRPIERERLEALPYADLCIEDKKKEEQSW